MKTPQPELSITSDVARRFLVGRQGVWPGRRWRGKAGTRNAIETLRRIQMDPVTIVARSHDLALWNRIEGYHPEHLQRVMYHDRDAFDYGGNLAVHPMNDLRHWRVHMERRRSDPKYQELLAETGDLAREIMRSVERHGPVSASELNRSLQDAGAGPRSTTAGSANGSYRSQSATNRLVYHLWLTGDLMTHHRDGFERYVDLAERVVPAGGTEKATESETEEFFALAALRRSGLTTSRAWRNTMSNYLYRRVKAPEGMAWLTRLIADREAIVVEVEGHRDAYYVLADEVPALERLVKGAMPRGWSTRGPSTLDEVRLLSPLDDIVSRERASVFFDFDYVWEIYKPDARRTYGPYAMPVLHGDALVGRIDPRLDRESRTMHINGIWIERDGLESDRSFMDALSAGVRSFARFHDATSIEVHDISFDGGAGRFNLDLC